MVEAVIFHVVAHTVGIVTSINDMVGAIMSLTRAMETIEALTAEVGDLIAALEKPGSTEEEYMRYASNVQLTASLQVRSIQHLQK
jgi:hypothetical protein